MRTAGGPIHYLVGPLWLSAPSPAPSPAPSLAPSPTNYVLSQSSHAFVIKRTREEHQTVQNRRTNLNVRNRTTPAMRVWLYLNPVTLVTSVMVHAEDLTLRLLPTTDATIETSVGKNMTS